MPETLDYYDDNMNYLGTASREQIHQMGWWHKTFHCWVMQRDRDGAYVLFQKRGQLKKDHPNKLDITVAGHLHAGEEPADGVREFREELGVPPQATAMRFLGIRVAASIVGRHTNREFNHVYLIESNLAIDSYRLQKEEVAALVRMRIDDGIQLFAGAVSAVHVDGIELTADGRRRIDYDVSLADIIPRKDNYYLKIFIMAERLSQGLEPVCI